MIVHGRSRTVMGVRRWAGGGGLGWSGRIFCAKCLMYTSLVSDGKRSRHHLPASRWRLRVGHAAQRVQGDAPTREVRSWSGQLAYVSVGNAPTRQVRSWSGQLAYVSAEDIRHKGDAVADAFVREDAQVWSFGDQLAHIFLVLKGPIDRGLQSGGRHIRA